MKWLAGIGCIMALVSSAIWFATPGTAPTWRLGAAWACAAVWAALSYLNARKAGI